MNNGIKFIFTFSLGAAIGSVITWKLIKTKYEQISKEEIESVKEVFSKRKPEEATESNRFDDIEEYVKTIRDVKYARYLDIDLEKEEKGGSESMETNIYDLCIIPPEEFGEDGDYETYTLIYYEDDVVTDDMGEVIEDVEDLVGRDFSTHFGEYEDDSVFVRNDSLQCCYEILRDYGNYSDLNPTVDE